ncbi:type III secretion system export apparatus subunit SctU [Rugamonas aquatica]|uniref:EscU/YscU/HrcU family type III secretion system export apparatus switch protein n=1 Tax=Rugamonas aquatica TaxID=2743357 RepID=A0A6A7N6N5_9BURK|nr:type III secretion system export apparatus subunit SctU [Rugamonas aquatica]MQA40720.1 EscU/YscU/HrcU family type III secretion system export apparatus switch protein [Rugamonas aquatica]
MSGEKTEQPTSKKLRDARKKGQVAHSKDFTQTVLTLALFVYLISAARSLAEDLTSLLLLPMALIGRPFGEGLDAVLWPAMKAGCMLLLPFLGIVLGVGVLVETLQVGGVLAFEAIKPSGKKLNVVANTKNIFSKKNLVEFLKNCLKVVVLCAVLYSVIRDELAHLLTLPLAGLDGVGAAITSLLKAVMLNVAAAYAVLALADLAWQRYSHTKELMMTKDEVKREHKESEGDPHIKDTRKQLHRELLSGAVEKSRQASVLITNPTHVAVALRYERGATPLPLVLAMGTDEIAHRMIAAARAAGVPVMQNVPLARALLAQGVVDQYIPSALVAPVAEVLRLVEQLARGEWSEPSA